MRRAFVLLMLSFTLSPHLAFSDITFPGTDTVVAPCDDYARLVLNDPWDMSENTDVNNFIPENDLNAVSSASFTSDGRFTFTQDDSLGVFYLWSPQIGGSYPVGSRIGQLLNVDRSKYNYLSIRMKNNTAGSNGVRTYWNRGLEYYGETTVTNPTATELGWGVYGMNLSTVGISAGESTSTAAWTAAPVTGLAVVAASIPGSPIEVDWIQLLDPTSCSNYSLNYNASAMGNDGRISIFYDTDTNPYNGYIRKMVSSATAANGAINDSSLNHFPGTYNVVGVLDSDYATLEMADPWDMSESTDVTASNFTPSFAAGAVSGTAGATAPQIVPKKLSGGIDAGVYTKLSLHLTQSAIAPVSIVWNGGSRTIPNITLLPQNGGAYEIDLAGQPNWSGIKTTFYIVPASTAGVNFSVDFISLRAAGYDSTRSAAALAGTVYTGAGDFVVNTPPSITIKEPSSDGGVAFRPWNARPLDIELSQNLRYDLDPSFSGEAYTSFLPDSRLVEGERGDFYKGANAAGNDDPHDWLTWIGNPRTASFSASEFKNLCFRTLVDHPFSLCLGSVARVVWYNTVYGFRISEDIVLGYNGFNSNAWQEYCVDLADMPEDGGTAGGWSGTIEGFRLDPHEFSYDTCVGNAPGGNPASVRYYLDYVKLRKDDEANTSYNIVLGLDDPEDDATVSLYYTSGTSPSGGALITTLNETDNSRVYTWNTAGVPDGSYLVYAVATDGVSTVTRAAEGRITINHLNTSTPTAPVLSLEAPGNGDVICDTMQVKGFALQTDRYEDVASVEVQIDGALIEEFKPEVYSPNAVTAHPDADSSDSGFNLELDTAGIAMGARTVTVRAFSTDGTSTSQNINVTRSNVGCTAFDSDPAPAGTPVPGDSIDNNDGVSQPIFGKVAHTPLGKLSFKLSRSVNSNSPSCTLNFYIGSTKNDVSTLVKSFTATTDVTKFSALGVFINPATLPKFFLDVERVCPGFTTQRSTRVKRVLPRTTTGKVSSLTKLQRKLARKLKKL